MTPLQANFKLLVKTRSFVAPAAVGFAWSMMIGLGLLLNHNGYLFVFLLCVALGWVFAAIQQSILTRPFSLCLPGHVQIFPRLFFWPAAILAIPFSFYVPLAHQDLAWRQLLLCSSTACLYNASAFLAPSLVVLGIPLLKQESSFRFLPAGLLPLMLFILPIAWSVAVADQDVEIAFLSHPLAGLGAFLAISVLAWQLFHDSGLARTHVEGMSILTGYAMNPRSMPRSTQFRTLNDRCTRRIFNSFVRSLPLGTARVLWGTLYERLTQIGPVTSVLILLLTCVILCGFQTWHPEDFESSSYWILVPMTGMFSGNFNAGLFIPTDRKRRFRAAVVFDALMTLGFAFLFLALSCLSLLGPDVSFLRTWSDMGFNLFLLTLVAAPLFIACSVITGNNKTSSMALNMLTGLLMLLVFRAATRAGISPWVMASAFLLVAWTAAVTLLWHHFRRGSLSGSWT